MYELSTDFQRKFKNDMVPLAVFSLLLRMCIKFRVHNIFLHERMLGQPMLPPSSKMEFWFRVKLIPFYPPANEFHFREKQNSVIE